jgi:hypothetical protein
MTEHHPPKGDNVTIQELIWRTAMAIGLVALALVALLTAQSV